MRYHNRKTGLEIDLGELDPNRQRLFETAQRQFRNNANWFEFEQLVFSYTSPIFQQTRSRADVVRDPLYKALKDMWLQLGIKQGFVASEAAPAHDRNTETKTRPSRPHRTARVRDVEAAGEPPVSRRRGR